MENAGKREEDGLLGRSGEAGIRQPMTLNPIGKR